MNTSDILIVLDLKKSLLITAKPRYNVPRHNVLPDITYFSNGSHSFPKIMNVGDVTYGLAIVWTIEKLNPRSSAGQLE